jgi:hypothetical protein
MGPSLPPPALARPVEMSLEHSTHECVRHIACYGSNSTVAVSVETAPVESVTVRVNV